MNWIPIGLNWTILFKCLEMTIVVIWRYINKTELNWIEGEVTNTSLHEEFFTTPYCLTNLLLGQFRREFRHISYSGCRLIVKRFVATWWNKLFKLAFHSFGVERLAWMCDCWTIIFSWWAPGQSPDCESCSGSAADAVNLTCGWMLAGKRTEQHNNATCNFHNVLHSGIAF